ncbi:MAG: T9SS type A sorting domain-containing protein [Bacteroidetes bacterium]|nr:T9SS type A sorting domain-containing protein [Bacteroidota bacterium]
MKKMLLSLLALVSAGSLSAQIIWQDNFNTPTPPAIPSNWTQYNGDGLTVATNLSTFNFGTNAWVSKLYQGSTTDKYMAATSWYAPPGTSNDWLISPSMVPTAGSFLVFQAQSAEGAPYQESYQVKISTTNNTYTSFTTNILSVAAENTAWTTHAINMSAYAGQTVYIAFVNNSFDKNRIHIDNVSLQVLPANDIKMTDMTPRTATYKSYAAAGGAIPVQGLVENLGINTITNYTVKINDGVNTTSFPQTASIASFGTHIFSVNYTMPSAGIKPIKMWVELAGDANHVNDSIAAEFGGATFTPTHIPVFEEATGTWCQWCPRGAVFMEALVNAHPSVVAIAVHNGDPMTVTAYDDGIGPLIGGYPSGLVGRKVEADPSDFLTEYNNHIADFGVADITLSQPTVSGTTITVKADVKMAVSTKPNYDYRLALVVTADQMHGTSSAWNQANAYAGGGAGVMGGYELLPSTVPAAQMYYDHVALNISGGFNGQTGSLPATMTAGTTYTHTFSWTAPATQDLSRCKANVLLISALSGEAQNGKWVSVFPNSVNNVVKDASLTIYPNPSNDYLNLDFTLTKVSDVTINLTDMSGKSVYNNNLSQLNGNQGLVINTSALSNGIYTLSLKTAEGTITRKAVIAH